MSRKIVIYDSTTFKRFVSKKRTYILILTLFFFLYYISLPVLTTFFPNIMNHTIIGGLPFAWFYALSQFFAIWLICFLYYRKAKSFDETVEQLKNESVNRGNYL
ncbi:DUF485 domain-containing protein [Anaerobacillus sp. MEB173]|uniref:DUF485 domain-containing protein n=1 Tax=Anaerobacillus sp. MEB173 TaxID=3383345 RepID=UPI003F93EDEC